MIRLAVRMPPEHWKHRQTSAFVCTLLMDDESASTVYDPWVEKMVGALDTGDTVWLYASKRRPFSENRFTCMVNTRNYGGGSILYARHDHSSLGAACRDAERWFEENTTE